MRPSTKLPIRRRDTCGSIGILTAVLMPVLLGFAGLGVETASWYSNQRQIERAADIAASAATPYLSGGAAATRAVAMNVALLNGMASTDTVTVTIPADNSTVSVGISRPLPQYFSGLFLPGGLTSSIVATAKAGPYAASVCMLVNAASGANALLVDSGASLNAPGCEIDVRSPDTSAAATFNASLTQIGWACVGGGSSIASGATIHGLQNNCATITDPYMGHIATPATSPCTVGTAGNTTPYPAGTRTLYPGVYCGNFKTIGTGTINFSPGLYVFAGGNFTSGSYTLNGSGVTFYFMDSNSYVDFYQSTVNLTAPTSGTYANILMFEAPSLSTGPAACAGAGCFNLMGQTSGNVLQGIIDLPSRNILIRSTMASTPLTLVANSLEFGATMSWAIGPSAGATGNAGSANNGQLQ